MSYKNYNLVRVREVQTNQGPKKLYDTLGKITLFQKDDGSESGVAEIYTLDKTVELAVFPFKTDNQTRQSTATQSTPPAQQSVEEEEIRVENIPF